MPTRSRSAQTAPDEAEISAHEPATAATTTNKKVVGAGWIPNLNAITIASLTLGIFLMNAVVLGFVLAYGHTPAVFDTTGSKTLDSFGNYKTVLLATLPFLTTVLGYWFGNNGTTKAKADADAAKADAKKANSAKAVALAHLAPQVAKRVMDDHRDLFLQ
jgi:hypothetical protein